MRYYDLARDHILFDLPEIEGWALCAAAREGDPQLNLQRSSLGYVGQQLDRS